LIKNGIPRRSKSEAHRKYSLNEDFFEIIDTEEKAYWLGFIAADGDICSGRPRMGLALAIKDKERVELFRDHIEATNPIYYRETKRNGKSHGNVGIRIRSKKLCKDLIDKGVVPRKSLILKPPKNVPENLIHHWIRGYFDGDGCVDYYGKVRKCDGKRLLRVRITSTKEVLEFIQKKFGSGHIYDRRPRSQVHTFRIGSQGDVRGFANFIYRDATVYLERKKLIFSTCLKK